MYLWKGEPSNVLAGSILTKNKLFADNNIVAQLSVSSQSLTDTSSIPNSIKATEIETPSVTRNRLSEVTHPILISANDVMIKDSDTSNLISDNVNELSAVATDNHVTKAHEHHSLNKDGGSSSDSDADVNVVQPNQHRWLSTMNSS